MARHERRFAKGIAGLQLSEELSPAAVARNGRGHGAAEDDAEVGGGAALVRDGFIGFEGPHARAIHELLQAFVGKVFEDSCLLLQEIACVHGVLQLVSGRRAAHSGRAGATTPVNGGKVSKTRAG